MAKGVGINTQAKRHSIDERGGEGGLYNGWDVIILLCPSS